MANNVHTEYVGPRTEGSGKANYRWWTEKGDTVYQSVFQVVNAIEHQSNFQHTMNIKHARLYSDLELLGFTSYRLNQANRGTNLSTNRITYNVVRSVIGTAASKIAKNKPKPQFLTDKGDWTQQDRAKKLTKYVEGVFYDSDIYDEAAKVFTDACVFGTGALKFYIQDGSIKVERVFIDELRVDYVDGAQGKPRQLHQVKYLNRDLLAHLYPKFKAHVYDAESGLNDQDQTVDDVVKVIESWHLETSKGAQDGRHSISIDNATLFEEEYNKDYFPFAFFRWSERSSGFFGYGVAEELTGMQLAINKTLMNIQKAQHLIAVPRVYLESSNKVVTSHINNDIGSVVKYNGQAPVFNTPTAMNAEVYNHLKWLIQSAYEITGISQLSATSQKPAGLDSGVALREFNDIETERFMLTGLRYEKMFMEASKIVVAMSRELYEEDPKLKITVPGSDFISSIKWKDVDLKDDQFIMKAWPISLLPSSPAGKLQKVQELVQAGWIPQDKAIQLLDFPDLAAYESLETANLNLIQKTLTEMVDTGDYLPPEPQMNLDEAIALSHQAYLNGRVTNLAEDRLELLLRFIDDADRMKSILNTEPQAAPIAEGQPTAVPEAPLQSELIPSIPQV